MTWKSEGGAQPEYLVVVYVTVCLFVCLSTEQQ